MNSVPSGAAILRYTGNLAKRTPVISLGGTDYGGSHARSQQHTQNRNLVIYRKQQMVESRVLRLPSLKKQSAVKIDTDAWIS